MRLAGSSGANITGENGATSAIWLASQSDCDSIDPCVVYHSDITRWGRPFVKPLDIEHSVTNLHQGQRMIAEMDKLIVDLDRRSISS